ncbi:hypothetical protein [Spirosoma agri]|uniref:Uncharacterized protein n=1 Tax=Spirosoma agri TaxID=1987381 RepID=A0A6M0IFA0_9BACT|nr:hypothetical protein [Spirosoma agri]NEU66939.1 hypothetical protein [Spirosoma agri]
MKNQLKSALYFVAVLGIATACQSKKTETDQAASDTTTVIENDTLTSGDATVVESDTTKIVVPDSTKK